MRSPVKPNALLATTQGIQLMDRWMEEPAKSAWEIASHVKRASPVPSARTLLTLPTRRSASESVQHRTIQMAQMLLKVDTA